MQVPDYLWGTFDKNKEHRIYLCLLTGLWLFRCLEAWLLNGTRLLIRTRDYMLTIFLNFYWNNKGFRTIATQFEKWPQVVLWNYKVTIRICKERYPFLWHPMLNHRQLYFLWTCNEGWPEMRPPFHGGSQALHGAQLQLTRCQIIVMEPLKTPCVLL